MRRFVLILIAVGCQLSAISAAAGEPLEAIVIGCHDGDTCTMEVAVNPALLPGLVYRVSVRVAGVDTPELNDACDGARALALRARDFVRAFRGEQVMLSRIKPDKYAGRLDARVTLEDGRDLATMLIAAGLGRPYDGGKRAGWCD